MNLFVSTANKILGDKSANNPLQNIKYIEVEQCPDYDIMQLYDQRDYHLGNIVIQNTLRDIAEFHTYSKFNFHKNGVWIMKSFDLVNLWTVRVSYIVVD